MRAVTVGKAAAPLEQRSARASLLIVALVAGLLVLVLLSFGLGQYSVSPGTVARIPASRVVDVSQTWAPTDETVVLTVRLPRILAALLVGAALASSGAAYQTMLRNPLVSPEVIGVAAGAAFGGSLGILLELPQAELQALAFGFGLLAAVISLAGQELLLALLLLQAHRQAGVEHPEPQVT